MKQEKATAAGLSYEDWYGNDQANEQAKGPNMNKTFCSSYTHKRCNNTDSDNSDNASGNNCPGHKVRIEAFNIMVENHNDKSFQQKEDKEANRLRKS
eukprot:2898688-Heterocapsa_arctica.AAC.1